ncbi:LuxR family transcriptional regulator [Longispora fulva]|uniref:ATP/maltotriose-dependent transcriptional regulator MalT n=1 Tax=Longispora fulva TaxID=619741 RepID=A0A8J7KJW7_9ACTN|nr:LuxR family transcriptional regulator [Longispora fulva]MBG6137329.1 ATP/maltotriose-dependent transcriptional regulator MalT [Longispora fulva]GIG61317.1 LuxR family transcriptional regulator [Longispora fulva]
MVSTSSVVVGRETELSLLDERLRAAGRRDCDPVVLLGEAGIGKSRLVAECAALAFVAGMPVLRGRGGSRGAAMPFRPLTEAMASLFRITGPPRAPELAPYRPALARLIPEWRDSARPAGPVNLVDLSEAVLRLLGVVGGDTGCLMVLEDVHDADAESLAVIEYLMDNIAGMPVLLLLSQRPLPGPPLALVREAARRRTATLLELAPLTGDQTRALAAHCLEAGPGQVPEQVLDRLVRHADGNPFVIEELLGAMTDSGALRRVRTADGRPGWRLDGDLGPQIPDTVVRGIAERVDRLGPAGRELLEAAAVLGHRFSLSTLQATTGLEDRQLLSHIRAAADLRLIAPDTAPGDWYAFRHALTAEALLSTLMPVERSALSRRAAEAVERAGVDEDAPFAAELWLAAGESGAAARLLGAAGRRTLAIGASTSAVALLRRAHALSPADGYATPLVEALADAGLSDEAFALAATLPPAGRSTPEREHRAALHTTLAWAAVTSGRYDEAERQAGAARTILGPDPRPVSLAAIDVVAARLLMEVPGPGPDQHVRAEALARGAADVAEAAALPEVACRAWQLLAGLARRDGYEEGDRCLERMLDIAERHALPAWRMQALLRLGVNEFLRTGESARLEQARLAAGELGAIVLGTSLDVNLGLQHVLRGDYPAATAAADRCERATLRMGNPGEHRSVLLTRAALAAHQGQRRLMEYELARFEQHGGDRSPHRALLFGLVRAVCALLEENHALAADELDRALEWELRHPTVYYLAGRYGLRVLVEVLAGRAGQAEHDEIAAAPAARLRWNRQFLLFAGAVLAGRAGRAAEATALFEAACEAAAPFPMAGHLGRRLVAEAAVTDGWEAPVSALRAAEEYFHAAGVPAVTNACRGLLRRLGAGAAQRRTGRDRIPPTLLLQGVTVREFEVLELLGEHPGNQSLAQVLFISPRTVEKHVGNLLTKTGLPDRAALTAYARSLD